MIQDTKEVYSFLWKLSNPSSPVQKYHFNMMQEVITEPIVRGRIGLEVGSGCGYDICIMARENPSVKLISFDISEGVYQAKKIAKGLDNVIFMRSSACNISLKDECLDFAYSFGVLHHIPHPKNGLSEIARVLKNGSPAFLYLYEDHSENKLKFIAVKIVSFLRTITARLSNRAVLLLSWLFSPLVYILFTLPSKILFRLEATKHIAGQLPFNFGTHPFSLWGDLYDRFKAPIEHRLSRAQAYELFEESGFVNVRITRLRNTAGWVVWGYKKQYTA